MTPWIITGLALLLWVVTCVLCAAQRSEILYLRSGLNEKRDHERRIERAEAGLPELKVEPAKSDIPPPHAALAIEDAIGAWDSPVTQAQKREDVVAWRRDGWDWDRIVDELRQELA